jgi:hypothetical protein
MFWRASLMDSSARAKSSGLGSILFVIVLFALLKYEIELCVDLHQHTDDAVDRLAIQGWRISVVTAPHPDRFVPATRGDKMSMSA